MKKFLMLCMLVILVISFSMYDEFIKSTPHQEVILNRIRHLGLQEIQVREILKANNKKGQVERKRLTPNEIAFVQERLKQADEQPIGGHNYIVYGNYLGVSKLALALLKCVSLEFIFTFYTFNCVEIASI